MNKLNSLKIDKTIFTITSLTEPSGDKEYWLSKSPYERLQALEILRHHRLLEAFLHEILGFPWDEVHEEADRLATAGIDTRTKIMKPFQNKEILLRR